MKPEIIDIRQKPQGLMGWAVYNALAVFRLMQAAGQALDALPRFTIDHDDGCPGSVNAGEGCNCDPHVVCEVNEFLIFTVRAPREGDKAPSQEFLDAVWEKAQGALSKVASAARPSTMAH